jgi:two-component system, OmpR family, response regulator CiaR
VRILVIEDYAPIRDSIVTCLRELGFAVSEADDGEKGLWLAEHEPHDVIILDIMLPGMDGFALLDRLR